HPLQAEQARLADRRGHHHTLVRPVNRKPGYRPATGLDAGDVRVPVDEGFRLAAVWLLTVGRHFWNKLAPEGPILTCRFSWVASPARQIYTGDMPEGKSSRTLRHGSRARLPVLPLSILLSMLASSIAACSSKDQAKCDEALGAARQALKSGQEDLMRQWRDRAWKYCEDAALTQTLDKEIVDTKQAALAKQQAEEAEKKKLENLGQTFADWVAQNRAAPKQASAVPECPEAERGKKEEERFCVATRK